MILIPVNRKMQDLGINIYKNELQLEKKKIRYKSYRPYRGHPTGRPYSNVSVPGRKAFTLHINWLGEQQLLCIFGTIFYFSFY